ncbi:unnamed protein product [Ceutorhynchus assimilis]|uniref:Beclin 1-associated autophagy-related key regulator n=1 Tax=Ceutorhynchus assimilis TaxID=467358 RepID=A0A9P0DYR5_9CUCU|nr:unnamed protein product [Ceutorhynchus assimilis]
MATNSSETEESTTSTAPRIFHISSSTDSPNVHKCPLCEKFKKYFYCRDCIQSGLITNKKNESLSNIQKALGELEENRRNVERKCLKSLENRQKYDILQTKIRQGKERNQIIQLALEGKRQRKHFLNQKLAELKERNQERSEKLKAYKTKSAEVGDCAAIKSEKVSLAQEKLHKKNKEVKKIARLRVQQLFKYIFPISLVKPVIEMESSGDSMIKELAEASQTTYLRDKWVYTDYSNEMQYSIVAPCLPGSGNYSNYNLWAQNRDGIPISEDTEMMDINPALTISAALTYAAQLVNVLSFLLNVRLPYKMTYSEFSSSTMNEQQFTRKVARLNANILYFCISQKIDISALSPMRTIHNILQLKDNDSADLGRQGPIEINELHARTLEKCIASDLKSGDDSDSDEGDSFTKEWEAVPHVQCPEVPAGPANVQSSVINPQQASSMAGGLMNSAVASVASIWRGFTGR